MAILYWTDFKKPIYEDAPLFLTTAGKTTQEKQNYPHGYPDYHLLITVSGEGVLRKSDGSYRLTPDILMIHGAGMPLEYAPTKKPWVTAWLTFNGKDASKLFRHPFGIYSVKNRTEIIHKIEEIINLPEARRQSNGKKLLREVFMLIDEGLAFPAVAPIGETQNVPIEKMCAYIEENYQNRITIADLCSVAECGKTKVNDLFKQHFNMSPIEYIIRFRIRAAEELLKISPEIPVHEVAKQCGFSSASHLHRYFNHGTPLQFRKCYLKHTSKL